MTGNAFIPEAAASGIADGERCCECHFAGPLAVQEASSD